MSATANAEFATRSSSQEMDRRAKFVETFESSPIPRSEMLYSQLSLYLTRQELSRMFAMTEL